MSCLLDLATNTTLTSQINTFIYATAGWAACDVGYDMEMSNFASSLYMNNFKTYTNMFSRNGYNVELIDYSDQIQALYNRTYTAAHWMADLSLIYTAAWGFNVNGPGVTEAADGSWVDQIASLTEVYGWTFTFRCLLFKDPAQATIANLLH